MESSADGSIPVLPLHTDITYIAEGAANVICKFNLPPCSPGTSTTDIEPYGPGTPPPTEIPIPTHDPIFDSKLLRLRKAIPSRVSNAEAVDYFKDVIAPLFPAENLISQDLVLIPPPHIQSLNEDLKHLESSGQRPLMRHGTCLASDEIYGILITDMRPRPESQETLIEFKPKWLSQSPTAPDNARRCRTCALRDMRNAERAEKGVGPEDGFCPIDLVSGVPGIVRVLGVIAPGYDETLGTRISGFLQESQILTQLKLQQDHFARKAGLSKDYEALATAMTLRDCTVFLRVPEGSWDKIEVRFGDLDLKNKAKAEKWAGLDKRLIDEGWYAGKRTSERCNLE